MKTTIDIADDLFLRGKKLAKRENVTLKTLVEEGLSLALSEREKRKPFKWMPVTFKGSGMAPEFSEGGWATIRDEIYRGRGA